MQETPVPAIQAAISEVPGRVGVAGVHLDSGREVSYGSDEVYFTASTFKVPLLVAMYRLVDEGRIDLSERVELPDSIRVPGSSILKVMGSGLAPTVHDLATLMIVVSDNTATDLIFHRVGSDYLNAMLVELGLADTRIPMTTRELLYSIVGPGPSDPEHTFEQASRLLAAGRLVSEADGFREDRSDVSSPADMSTLLAMLHRGEILSEESRAGALEILKRQQLNTVIPLLLPPGTVAAHKTGNLPGVTCDVGIVYGPSGPYTVALMAKGVEGTTLEVDLSLARVSRAIYDHFNVAD